ncbi:MAG: hypothetical protein EOO04_17525 [Chitinophagaceae bacterium]|nr:MAG: hypothetical protein EOO04_17525 [Chitinophagaceae bacterium]
MENMVVRFNFPKAWETAVQGLASNFRQQTPGASGKWEGYSYEINNGTPAADIWVVMGDVDTIESATTAATVFIVSEEQDMKTWHPDFLSQFDYIVGSQDDLKHPGYIKTQYLCPWQVKKSFDTLNGIAAPAKTKDLSAIVSDMTWKEGHKQRFAFVNQIKGHFKGRLDWFGRGNVFIDDKWDGLAPYRYSIAIENSRTDDYWTEKLMDCFLSYTIPMYSGCTNLERYFPEGSYIRIYPSDLERSIAIIEEAIKTDYYSRHFDKLTEARELVLHKYQFFPKLSGVLMDIALKSNKTKRVLRPESFFTREKMVEKIKRVTKSIIR